jgi:class 3 adenylate cyclase
MLAFESARDAIACAVAIQRALREEVNRDPRGGVRVRIGMSSGEVEAQHAQDPKHDVSHGDDQFPPGPSRFEIRPGWPFP